EGSADLEDDLTGSPLAARWVRAADTLPGQDFVVAGTASRRSHAAAAFADVRVRADQTRPRPRRAAVEAHLWSGRAAARAIARRAWGVRSRALIASRLGRESSRHQVFRPGARRGPAGARRGSEGRCGVAAARGRTRRPEAPHGGNRLLRQGTRWSAAQYGRLEASSKGPRGGPRKELGVGGGAVRGARRGNARDPCRASLQHQSFRGSNRGK